MGKERIEELKRRVDQKYEEAVKNENS